MALFMLAIFSITAPLFMIMAMGFFAMRFELLTPPQLAGMGKFVVKLGLPMLVFHAIATRSLDDVVNMPYLLGYGTASLLSFFAGWGISRLHGQDKTLAALNGLGMGMSNTGFIGYPLLAMVMGTQAGVYLAMNAILENMLVLPLMFIMIDLAQGGGKKIGTILLRIVKNLLKNPIIAALILALICVFCRVPVPAMVEKVTGMMAHASSPLALFVIGGGLYGVRLRSGVKDMLVVTMGKLLLFPLLVIGCVWAFGATRDTLFAAALLASVPMASMYALFGLQYGHEQRTAATMLLTTLMSFFSISLVLLLGQ